MLWLYNMIICGYIILRHTMSIISQKYVFLHIFTTGIVIYIGMQYSVDKLS